MNKIGNEGSRNYANQITIQKSAIATEYRRNVIPNFGTQKSTAPPQWVLDKIADEKLSGKYNVKKTNRCNECFTYKATNGKCMCS